jgi:ATP-dependent DNA helicase RecQ (EC 3.6.1.-)
LSKAEWKGVFRQLVAMNLLVVDVAGHGGLHLGPDCRAVLRGERRIDLRRDRLRGRKAARSAARSAVEVLHDPADQALFDALRALRMQLAKAQGVPPYVIFHDSTLVEIARNRPHSVQDMAHLPGVGEAKLARYGAAFLAVVENAGR